jgi:hypothetical protein
MAKSCFFISRIGDAGSQEREFSDKLLKYIIEPVLEKCGFEKPLRADQITQPGVITTQVFTHLLNDDLVIADITGSNPNVFYELAVRHIRKRPFVHMIQTAAKIPFDIAPNRTIEFDFDIEKAEQAKTALEAMVRGSNEDPLAVQTPLSAALDFSTLARSSDPVRDGITQILSTVQDIKGTVARIAGISGGKRGLTYSIRQVAGGYAFQLGNEGPIKQIETEETLCKLLELVVGSESVRSVVDQLNQGRVWIFEYPVKPPESEWAVLHTFHRSS